MQHLVSAAHTLECILAELHPEHDWVVHVRESELADRGGKPAPTIRLDETGTGSDHSHALGDRNAATPAGRRDDHTLKQAA